MNKFEVNKMSHAILKICYCPRCDFKRQVLINKKMPKTILCRNCGYRYAIVNSTTKYPNGLYGVRGV